MYRRLSDFVTTRECVADSYIQIVTSHIAVVAVLLMGGYAFLVIVDLSHFYCANEKKNFRNLFLTAQFFSNDYRYPFFLLP